MKRVLVAVAAACIAGTAVAADVGVSVTVGQPGFYGTIDIGNFPRPQAFARMIEDAGFRRVSFRQMTGGIVALHSGWKL